MPFQLPVIVHSMLEFLWRCHLRMNRTYNRNFLAFSLDIFTSHRTPFAKIVNQSVKMKLTSNAIIYYYCYLIDQSRIPKKTNDTGSWVHFAIVHFWFIQLIEIEIIIPYGRDNETLYLYFFYDFVRIMLTIGQSKFIIHLSLVLTLRNYSQIITWEFWIIIMNGHKYNGS